MAINKAALASLSMLYLWKGRPAPLEEIRQSSMKTSAVGSGLEILASTPHLGVFELEIKEPVPGTYYVALSHARSSDSKKRKVYENSRVPASEGPVSDSQDYMAISPFKDGQDLTLSLCEPGLGRVILDLHEDLQENATLTRIRLFDSAGHAFADYHPDS